MSDTLNETANPETLDAEAQMTADLAKFDSDVELLAREFDAGVKPKDELAEVAEQGTPIVAETNDPAPFDPVQDDPTFAADFQEATEIVSGELSGLSLPKTIIEHVMRGIDPEEHPVLARAWILRAEAPELLERELRTFARDLRGSFKAPIDRAEMETTEAVAAAIRTASVTSTSEPLTKEAWRNMSPADQRALQKEHGVRPI